MNDPDSISDPVARRLCCTESYPSTRGSARLNSARRRSARGWWRGRWVPLCWRVCWLVDDVSVDMTCLLCMLTSHLDQADVIPCMPTVHADITIMSCWRHSYPGQPCGSSQLVFGSGQPIRAKKTRGARLRAWADALPESDGECGHVWRPILTPFSPVASSRPPLQSGMVKTPFWELLFLSKNQTPLKPSALIPIVGESGSPMRGPGVYWYLLIGGLSTLTQYLTWFGKTAYIHGRGSFY
jgi:hypothetical protein